MEETKTKNMYLAACLFKDSTIASRATLNSFLSRRHATVLLPPSREIIKITLSEAYEMGSRLKVTSHAGCEEAELPLQQSGHDPAKEDKEATGTGGKREYVSNGCNFKSSCTPLPCLAVSRPSDRRW